MTRPTALSVRAKLAVLAVVCIVAVVGTTLSILHSRDAAANRLGKGPASPAVGQRTKAATLDGSYLVFRSTALNRDFGRLEVVPLVDPTATPALTSMKCDRVDFEGGHGVCLNEPTAGLFASTTASVFDSQFHVLHTVPVTGYPSRVRVSPDGEYAATTTFVSGDSYATMGFSTRTSILDLSAGKVLYGLEKLVVRKNGKVFQAADFNFWGVTFAQNSRLFYATLGTGGHTYLIQGDVITRQATVLQTDVECPALSPDGTRIAFKHRVAGPVVTWRLSVLDLATMKAHPLAESRNVDDQAEWLDNSTIMYGLPEDPSEAAHISANAPGPPVLGGGASLATDTWTVPSNGSGSPKELIPGSWSTVVVRP